MASIQETAEHAWRKVLNNTLLHHIPKTWRNSFDAFIRDVGMPPSERHYLRRMNVRQPYNYKNAKWVDPTKGKGEHIIGQRFGRLVVVDATKEANRQMVIARCDCGSHTKTCYSSIVRGDTESCGCLHREAVTTHGGKYTATWNVWRNMRLKCFNKSSQSYKNFGAKGITICERWNNYANFLADMGEKPNKEDGGFLNRRDRQGNFTPENCYWSKTIDWDR